MGKIMDDIVKDSLIEDNENLDRLDQELVKLESDPISRELLDSIFRTILTIKGSCDFLGFPRREKVAHEGENLLAKLREGRLMLNSEISSGELARVDALRRMLAEIQAPERDGDMDHPELLLPARGAAGKNRPAESVTGNNPPRKRLRRRRAYASTRLPNAARPAQARPSESAPGEETTQPQKASPASPEHLRSSSAKIGGVRVERGSIARLMIWPLPCTNRSAATDVASVRSSPP